MSKTNTYDDLTDEEVTQISAMLKKNDAQVLQMVEDHFVRRHPLGRVIIPIWFKKLWMLIQALFVAEGIGHSIIESQIGMDDSHEQATGQT